MPKTDNKFALTKEAAEYYYNLYSTNLYEFVKFFMSHYMSFKVPAFHQEIYQLLPTSDRLVLASPRGFAKSTICAIFYPLWCALFKHKSNILIISASEGLAALWVRKIRSEIENNEKIKFFFGDLKSDKWTETNMELSNGVTIMAKGGGGQIRGFRPDLLIIDDIETDDSVASEEQRSNLRDWIFKACMNTMLPQGQMVMIGTIISPLALLNEFLNQDNGWTKKLYQAYIGAEERVGKELWGDLWSHEKLQQRKKEIGTWAFACEFLNDPISSEAAPIKENQIRYWETLPPQVNMVMTIDPAYKDDSKADYKVASLIAIDEHSNRYLVSYIRTHAPQLEFINAALNMFAQNKNRITVVGVPAGREKEFFDSFIRISQERGMYLPVKELKNVFAAAGGKSIRNKTARIVASLQPLFEAGKYYIKKEHREAKDELLTVGFSRWDDIVDTLAYAEQIIQPVFFDNFQEEERGRYGELMPDETTSYNAIRKANYGYEV